MNWFPVSVAPNIDVVTRLRLTGVNLADGFYCGRVTVQYYMSFKGFKHDI